MGKYNENISDKSVWLTATPTQAALSLPFYITEAGHFYAEPDYEVSREMHDSYLLIYTQNGCGTITSGAASFDLPIGRAAVINCHKSHSYFSNGGAWEFLWMHIKGSSVNTFFDMLYPNGVFAVNITKPEKLTEIVRELMYKIHENDILNTIRLSAELHEVFNILISDSLKNEHEKGRGHYLEYVEHVINLIHQNYSQALTIEDIIDGIPISKYHFIRIFKRIMGITPYSYLTNYRINSAKILLRTTDMSVSEIAEKCGFSDTSNFIVQFKKNTDQKPLQYRKYF